MLAQWYDLQLDTRETRLRTLPWASRVYVTTRSMSTLPHANLRYQEALDWCKWTKERCSFLFTVRSVLVELAW